MVQMQINIPEEYDKLLRLYVINNDFKTKAEAVVHLTKKALQPEKKAFMSEADDTKDKMDLVLNAPEN